MKKQVSTVHTLLGVVFTLLISPSISFAQLPSYVPIDGLVGYWPFNGNAEDASGNGYNATLVNGPTLSEDRNGSTDKSFYFDGHDDYVTATVGEQKSLTLSIWYKSKQPINWYPRLFSIDDITFLGLGGNHPFWIRDSIVGHLGCSPDDITSIPFNPNFDEWHHVVVIHDHKTGTRQLYIDNILQKTGITTAYLNVPNGIITIGNTINGNAGDQYAGFKGNIDDIGIWNRVLTTEEVDQLFIGQIKQPCLPSYVPTDSLVGYWPFCGNADDASGNGNHGVVNGATLATDRFGNKDKAYNFDGVNDEIPIGNLNVNGNWTISLFSLVSNFNPEVQTQIGLEDIGCCSASIGTTGDVNGCAPPPRNLFLYDGNSGCANVVYSNISLSANNWYHTVVVKNNGVYKIYNEGNLVGTSTALNDIKLRSVIFGSRSNQDKRFFNGSLDDIAIWNRALTPEEIEKLYNDSKEYSCDLSDILNPAVDYGTVTDIDGNVYPTVKIGEQEWMADNLRTTRYQNGETILQTTPGTTWANLNTGAWIYFKNDENYNCPNGKLYNWFAADDHRNVCPVDWHIPTDLEWRDLFNSLGGQKLAALKMKTSSGWTGGSNGTNESGFNSFESGFYVAESGGIFYGQHFAYWSKTAINDLLATRFWHQRIYGEGILNDFISKFWGNSIRCVKDRPGQCNLIEKIDPANRTTVTGSTVSFNAEYNTNNATYQWQSNTASTGWSDISPSSAYVGVNTTKLTIQSAQISNHLQKIRLVATNGTCFDTSNVATVFITDTCLVTLTDTVLTTVTDTLLIDVVLSGTSTPGSNLIRVYPNPTSSQLVIDAGQYTLMNGYTLTVTAANGAAVWAEAITQPVYTLDLSGWGGKGLYYITLTDPQGKVITTRKIVLQ